MRKVFACIATAICLLAGGAATATAAPVPGISQPVGSVPVPEGPAQAWILADMDTGHVLAARDEYGQYAPASRPAELLSSGALLLGASRPAASGEGLRSNVGYFNPTPAEIAALAVER